MTTPRKTPAVTDLDVAQEMVRRGWAMWVGSAWGDDKPTFTVMPPRSADAPDKASAAALLFESRRVQVRDELVRAKQGNRGHDRWREMAVGYVRKGVSKREAVRLTVATAAGEGVAIDADNLLKRVRTLTR